MKTLPRCLRLAPLLKQKSHFLFGPRSIGKTTLIQAELPKAVVYDLLDLEVYDRLLRRPKLIEEEFDPKEILVIDEIQKLPKLLDSIQRLIQKKSAKVLMTGSSARKLKRDGANLLGGRAWEAQLFPLTSIEIPDFDLLQYVNRGGLPHIYYSSQFEKELAAYTRLFIQEEIIQEAQLRKVDQFIRFLDVIGLQNGEELHFQGISNDTGIPAVTIQTYIELLEDTLIGYELKPFIKTKKRKAITRSKLFLFDLGVTRHLARRGTILDKSELFGKAFEHFIINEVRAWNSYREHHHELAYWRSVNQQEVDLIIGNEYAVEIKATELAQEHHLKGLLALKEEGLIKNYILVSQDPAPRVMKGIQIMPYRDFLREIWGVKLNGKSL